MRLGALVAQECNKPIINKNIQTQEAQSPRLVHTWSVNSHFAKTWLIRGLNQTGVLLINETAGILSSRNEVLSY